MDIMRELNWAHASRTNSRQPHGALGRAQRGTNGRMEAAFLLKELLRRSLALLDSQSRNIQG